jgi:hypothetical protein
MEVTLAILHEKSHRLPKRLSQSPDLLMENPRVITRMNSRHVDNHRTLVKL